MQLVKYNPFQELQRIEHDFDKLWQNGWGLLPAFTEASAMDLYEEDGNLIAEVNLPNFKKNEVKVNADAGALEVSAEHKEEKEKKSKRHYFFRESSSQYFRRVALPENAEASKAVANFKNGVLKVVIPMTASTTPKAIEIT